ncbi:MAG: cation:proton antiporter [Paludibacteraceae bacterium]|nr:cation:proton antiporter [Paludibacteraceae bacterium]MBR1480952.1 cation:proton antiporter [Paludibacteraceae bacterium]
MTHSLVIVCVVLGIMLLIPPVCRKVHVPAIVGFILAGIVAGPHVLGLLPESNTIRTLGQMGMLYIMLQSGIEVDMNDFSLYKRKAFVFGLYSFLFPMVLGTLTAYLLLHFSLTTSLLLGAMYGSHTLMTFPIVSRYGIQKNAAVNITVGGTMVAITLSLLVLAGLTGPLQATGGRGMWLRMAGMCLIFGVVVLGIYPYVVRRIFKRWQDPSVNFVLVMLLMVGAALLATAAQLEGILGAFVCGVALNSLIPNRSPLMERINFVGSQVFVPIFLLSVGMMIDIHVLWQGWTVLLIAAVMTCTKLAGKWLASRLAQWQFGLQPLERQLIFGLTHASAAGTLAVATIGYQAGILNTEILNAAVIMILVLCTLSSFVTEHAAKQLALQEAARMENERTDDSWTVMSVGGDLLPQLKTLATLSDLRMTQYVQCSDWQEARTHIERNSRSTVLYHEAQPLNTINRLLVAVPRYAEKEHDFISCFGLLRRLSGQIGARIVFFADEDTQTTLRALCQRPGKYLRASYRLMGDWEDVLMMAKEIQQDDMVVMISARHATPSYNPLFERVPHMLTDFFAPYSHLLIYPEQETGADYSDQLLTDQPQASRTWSLVSAVKQLLLKLINKLQHK